MFEKSKTSIQFSITCDPSSFSTSLKRTVVKMTKGYGDNGQPCLIPVCCVCSEDVCPSVLTVKVGFLYSALIMFSAFCGTPVLDSKLQWKFVDRAAEETEVRKQNTHAHTLDQECVNKLAHCAYLDQKCSTHPAKAVSA